MSINLIFSVARMWGARELSRMSMLKSFFTQEVKPYRNFQIVFTILTLNFVIPAISYSFFPETALEQFKQISLLLGAGNFDATHEIQSRIWRYLGAANVMTLGLMCLLLQINLKKFYPVLYPLVFLKAYNASLYLLDFIRTGHVAFLAVAIFDYITTWAFIYFARKAFLFIRDRSDKELIPRPLKITAW